MTSTAEAHGPARRRAAAHLAAQPTVRRHLLAGTAVLALNPALLASACAALPATSAAAAPARPAPAPASRLADAPILDLHLPAGPLDRALFALAAQAHEQLLFAPELAAGRMAPAVDGRLTAEQALQRLLAHTDIEARRAAPGVLVLRDRRASLQPAAARGGSSPDSDPPRPFGAEGAPADPSGSPPGQIGGAGAGGPSTPANEVAGVEVTGSHIRGAPPASPLLELSAEDLVRSGQTTLAGALQALPQNFGGGAAEGTSNTGGDRVSRNANFSTGVNLRGLGNNATLVLINGRRISGSGAFGDFADLSLIPTAAVERVEVLLDGASAAYGSDAVGGVVNVILKTRFDGAETRLETGQATAGRPKEYQVSQLLGRRWGSGSAMLAYEHQDRGDLPGADRSFAANADLRPLGGSDQRQIFAFPGNILSGATPGWAIPPGQNGVGLTAADLRAGTVNLQNERLGQDLLPRQILDSGYLAAEQDLGPQLRLNADARYSRRRYAMDLTIPIGAVTVTRANPYFVSPAGGASDTIAYSFNDLGNVRQRGQVESFSTTLGGTYDLAGDWRLQGHLAFGRDKEDNRAGGQPNLANLAEALGTTPDNPATPFSAARDGYFNPFTGVVGANSPAVLAFVGAGYTQNHIAAKVTSANLQADGTVLSLPGGPLKLALGAQARRETLQVNGTNYISTVTPVAQIGADVARRVSAAFAEFSVPIVGPETARPGVRRLELSLAGRLERYSDVGSTKTPKVGLLWEPTEGLRLRATYGTSFRAPALRESHDVPANVTVNLPAGPVRVLSLLLTGGNPGLRPETATTWTAGFDLTPPRLPGLTLSASWYDVVFRDRIDRPVQQNLSGALLDPTLASFIRRISPTTSPADLARISALLADPATQTTTGVFPPTAYGAIVDNRFVNTATLRAQGLDLTGGYRFAVGGDPVALGLNASYALRYRQQLTPTAPSVDRLGIAGYPVRLRARATADWTHGRLTAGAALNFVSRYHDAQGAPIAAQPTADLQLRLAPADTGPLAGVTAILTVRNVLDRKPPFYNNVFGVGYDPTTGDPIGRFVALELRRAW